MSQDRVAPLIAKLEKGIAKTAAILGELGPADWQRVVYPQPYPWTARDLLAHFYSAEESLLRLAQDVAAGGPGAAEGFDYDAFNAQEQQRLAGRSAHDLLSALATARERTVEWVGTLDDEVLDRVGRHPALGQVTLEIMVTAIYGHQLLHMRDLMAGE